MMNTTTGDGESSTFLSGAGTGGWRLPELTEFFLAAAIFVAMNSLRRGRRRGLPVWPVVGMLPSLIYGLRSDTYEWLTGVLVAMNGTFVFSGPWFSNLHAVITSEPKNLEHVLKTRFGNYPKGTIFRDAMNDLLGDGIFSTDDDMWRRQRRTASLEFHSAGFRAMTAESLVELVHSRLFPVLDSAATSPVDLQDVLLRLTFDNVCMIAFGVDPGCLRSGLPEISFARAFENATEATTLRFVTPTSFWKALRYLGLGSERTLRDSLRHVDEFAYDVIAKRKKELISGGRGGADLLTMFMSQKDEDGRPHSDKFLRDVCVNFILAGRDTSSVALAWFFWLLSHNPEAERRVMNELAALTTEDSEEVFRPEEIKKMEYLHAAVTEALRLYPSVPVDHKQAEDDDELPDGTAMRKGTKVLYSIYSMGRMESIWGSDCREFRPERWLAGAGDEDGKKVRFVGESAYRFAAFNGGPRLCLGKEFAYYQMKFVAASVLRRYKVDVAGGQVVEPKLALTMYMKHGLKVTLRRREEEKKKKNGLV